MTLQSKICETIDEQAYAKLYEDTELILGYGPSYFGSFSREFSDYHYYFVGDKFSKPQKFFYFRDNVSVTSPYTQEQANNVHITALSKTEFKKLLQKHDPTAIECYSMWSEVRAFVPELEIEPALLFKTFTQASQKNWRNAQKILKTASQEKEFYNGWQNLFDSIRLLDFGYQFYCYGLILDYASCKSLWNSLWEHQETDYKVLKKELQPLYNELYSKFKEVTSQ